MGPIIHQGNQLFMCHFLTKYVYVFLGVSKWTALSPRDLQPCSRIDFSQLLYEQQGQNSNELIVVWGYYLTAALTPCLVKASLTIHPISQIAAISGLLNNINAPLVIRRADCIINGVCFRLLQETINYCFINSWFLISSLIELVPN